MSLVVSFRITPLSRRPSHHLSGSLFAWCSVSHWSGQLPLQQGYCPHCLCAVSYHYALTTQTEVDRKSRHQPARLSLCPHICSFACSARGHSIRTGFAHMNSQEHLRENRTAEVKSCEGFETTSIFTLLLGWRALICSHTQQFHMQHAASKRGWNSKFRN